MIRGPHPPDSRAPGPRWYRLRLPFVLGGAALMLVPLLVCSGLWGLAGPAMPELTEEAFEQAIARWDAHGPADYDMDLAVGGPRAGVVQVQVRGGEVTSCLRDGRAPSQRRTWDIWSVSGLFDMIDDELRMAADPVGELNAVQGTRFLLRAQFHPEQGYPQRFHRIILGTPSGPAPEISWDVTRFEALAATAR